MLEDVFRLAAFLGERFGTQDLISVRYGSTGAGGCDSAAIGPAIELDFADPASSTAPVEVVRRSVVVCANAIDHPDAPGRLLERLAPLARTAPVTIITTALADDGAATLHAARSWETRASDRFVRLLDGYGINATLVGFAGERTADRAIVAMSDRCPLRAARAVPDSFRPLALMATYNEADIAPQTVVRLLDDGFDVVVADNWSTDGTFEELAALAASRPGLSMERYPSSGPNGCFDDLGILEWKEGIAAAHAGRWIASVDSDEIRCSPWTDVSFRGGLHVCDLMGFNAVDFTVLNFLATDDRFEAGLDPERTLRHFEFGRLGGYFLQIRVWKQGWECVNLRDSGGHEAQFAGRRVFPYKFLLKHYPLRSSGQARRKIFTDRLPRYTSETRARGWHIQYDEYRPDDSPLKDPSSLLVFEDRRTRCEHLIQLLSGIGAIREPSTGASLPARSGSGAEAETTFGPPTWPISPDEGVIAASELFDRDWYLSIYPDVGAAGVDPVRHYATCGAAEGRNPGPGFSTRGYLKQNPDVRRSGMNPLVHFVMFGRQEGRGRGLHWRAPSPARAGSSVADCRLDGHGLSRRVMVHAGVSIALDLSSQLASHDEWIRMIDAGWERPVFEFLGSALREGDVFFDFGASLGPFSIMGAHKVGALGRVVAVEPDPFAVALLRHNLALNQCEAVTVLEAALHTADEPVGLRRRQEWGDSQTRTVSAADAPDRLVAGMTLGRICRDLHVRPTAMKIDIEGGECMLLDPGTWQIVSDARVVALEVHAEALGAHLEPLTAQIANLSAGGSVEVVELERRSPCNFNLAWRRL